MSVSVGVDVGGTFTDLVAVSAEGTVHTAKVLSTRDDQSAGVAAALAQAGLAAGAIARLVHGTTVATNALLERTGGRVVLCATAGATDLLELRRQERAALYDLTRHHRAPLVAPGDVVAVDERIAPEGIVRPLDLASARAVAEEVARRDPDAVVVSLLHAYADARHERALCEAVAQRLTSADVVASTDVLPEIREYERTATAVAEAYLRPVVGRYLERLAERLTRTGHPAPWVMTSGGGVRPAAAAARSAAALALSGPAGGVVGAAAIARALGIDRALTIDIGGTSADVGLILDGAPLVEPGGEIAGVPIALPRVLVETVSAGGGSIAWVDDGGALRVGPGSAGADPGPVAFGRGGSRPTVTDAHVALENVGDGGTWSGGVALHVGAARVAVEALARALGRDLASTAEAIVATADAAMARALRRVSVERGIDPRECVLVAFGGGGPLHACGLAEQLGVRRIVIPPHAGVLSALGLAITAERREALASVMRGADELEAASLERLLRALEVEAGEPAAVAERHWWLRARYRGQGHQIEVPVTPGEGGEVIAPRFAALHGERTGFVLDRPVEVISARYAVSAPARELDLGGGARGRAGAMLEASGRVRGRATRALPDATLLVATGWTAEALPIGGWLLENDR